MFGGENEPQQWSFVVVPSAVLLQILNLSEPAKWQMGREEADTTFQKTSEIRKGIWYGTEGAVTWERQFHHQAWCGVLGSKIILSAFIMEAHSVRGGTSSTEVLKFICRVFLQTRSLRNLQRAGRSRALPPSLNAHWQAISYLCYRGDSQREYVQKCKQVFCLWGKKKKKILFSPSCLYLPFCLPCLPPSDD